MARLDLARQGQISPDWPGLDWIGLEWTGLDQATASQTRLTKGKCSELSLAQLEHRGETREERVAREERFGERERREEREGRGPLLPISLPPCPATLWGVTRT